MIFRCSSIAPCSGDFGANGTTSHISDTQSENRSSRYRRGMGSAILISARKPALATSPRVGF